MNRIEKMIADLCPNGVEWKELGEVAEVGTGNNNTNEQEENGIYPFYVRSKDVKKINTYSYDEEAIIIPGEGGVGEIFHYINGKYGLHQRAYRISIYRELKINTRYVYYYMVQNFKKFILKHAVSATVSSIRKPMITKFSVPIPPLEIQEEIVKILDTMTEHVTELQSELQMRTKQYEYYREDLLTFEEHKVEWKTLGEVFEIIAGGDVPKNNFSNIRTSEYSVPILSNGIGENAVYGWTNIMKITKPSLTVSARGTIGWASFRESSFYPIVRLLVLTPKVSVNLRYSYHYMKSIENFYEVPQSGIPQLTKPMISNIKFPIPSLETQEKIVYVLDNFDKVCNDLNIGLPKEIELRQKEYEYYREKLLTFDKEFDSTH